MRRAAVPRLTLLCVLAAASCRIERAPAGRPGPASVTTATDSVASAEVYSALRLYYARLTSRDWTVLAQSFWPRATITTIMQPAADSAERVHTIAIEEFVALATKHGIRDCPATFTDEIARANIVTYGPLADAWVTYRAHCGVTRDSVAVHYGMDAFHLMRHSGEWRVTGLTFTMETADQPLSRLP
jgi:Putative lumazine-binding